MGLRKSMNFEETDSGIESLGNKKEKGTTKRIGNIKKAKELNIFGQIRLIIPLLGKIKKVVLILLVLLSLSFLTMVRLIGIELAIIGELIIILILLMLVVPLVSLKKIPPIHIGVPLILGERTGAYILKEGWAIIIKGIFEHMPVYVGKVNLDFKLIVRAKDNAQAELRTSMLIGVDRKKVIEYLNAGGVFGIDIKEEEHKNENAKGIADSVIDMAKSSITMTSKKKTLDEILKIHEDITVNAIKKITRAKEGVEIDALKPDVEYEISGLGMLLNNFVIKEPEPTGKIAEVFEKQAVEMLEREFELTNIGTKILQIQEMIKELGKKGKTINPETMYLILTEQELLEKGHKITPGLNRLLNSLAGLIEGGAGISDILELIKSFKGDSK